MDNSNIKPGSVIVGNCLACEGLVRIPAGAKTNTVVRCPHCAQSFPLQQILDSSIPELEILPGEVPKKPEIIPHADKVSVADREPDPDAKPKAPEKFIVPRQLTTGAKRKRRSGRRDSSSSGRSGRSSREPVDNRVYREQKSAPQTQAESPETTSAPSDDIVLAMETSVDADPSISPSNSQSQRPSTGSNSPGSRTRTSTHSSSRASSRTSETNPLLEVLKVVIGGVLAFPIAYLMLFWIFGQDPLKLGPSLGKVVPFVVPTNLRGTDDEKIVSQPAEKTEKIESESATNNQDSQNRSRLKIPDFDPDKIGNEDIETPLDPR